MVANTKAFFFDVKTHWTDFKARFTLIRGPVPVIGAPNAGHPPCAGVHAGRRRRSRDGRFRRAALLSVFFYNLPTGATQIKVIFLIF